MDLLQFVLGVLAIVAIAAGVAGYFKANVSKATIELYKQNNDALQDRVGILEDQAAVSVKKILALEAANETLLDVVTQAAAIAHVQATVDAIARKLGVVAA